MDNKRQTGLTRGPCASRWPDGRATGGQVGSGHERHCYWESPPSPASQTDPGRHSREACSTTWAPRRQNSFSWWVGWSCPRRRPWLLARRKSGASPPVQSLPRGTAAYEKDGWTWRPIEDCCSSQARWILSGIPSSYSPTRGIHTLQSGGFSLHGKMIWSPYAGTPSLTRNAFGDFCAIVMRADHTTDSNTSMDVALLMASISLEGWKFEFSTIT